MTIDEYRRGIPTHQDNGKTIGMLCETKEQCITDDEGVVLTDKLEKLKKYTDNAYANSNLYTDTKIGELINGAPTTLDTLKEVADAMEENADVVEALEAAVGSKVAQAEYDGHADNDTIHITAEERERWNNNSGGGNGGDASTLNGLTATEVGESGARNLIPYPYVYSNKTQDGIVWTDNGDGTVSASGTNTNNSQNLFNCRVRTSGDLNPLILQPGTYTISGCPNGGGGLLWYIQVGRTVNDAYNGLGHDYGDGCTFTLAEEAQIQIQLVVRTADTVNLTFRPMLEIGSVAHDYVPYHLGGAEDSKKLNGLGAEAFVKGVSPFFASGETVLDWANNPNGVYNKMALIEVSIPSDGVANMSGFYTLKIDDGARKTVTFHGWYANVTKQRHVWAGAWTGDWEGLDADTVDGYHASEWFMHSETETARFKSLTEIPNGKWKFFEGQNMFTDYPASLTARGLIYGIVNIDTNATNTNYKTGTIIATNATATAVDSVHFFWNRDIRQLSFVEHLPLTGGYMNGPLTITHGSGDYEGGEFYLQKPTLSKFENNITIDAANEAIRMFAVHDGKTKGFLLDFASLSGFATVLHTGNIGQHALTRYGAEAVDQVNVLSPNHNDNMTFTRVICSNGLTYLVNALPNYTKVRQIAIAPKDNTDNPNDALRYQYTEDGNAWYNVAIHHDGNSAKCVVVDTDPGVGASVSYADGTLIFVKEQVIE